METALLRWIFLLVLVSDEGRRGGLFQEKILKHYHLAVERKDHPATAGDYGFAAMAGASAATVEGLIEGIGSPHSH